MTNDSNIGLFGQPMRWYVDRVEWPFVGLSLFFIFGFLVSYWIEFPYLEVVAPLVLIAQLVGAIFTAYFAGIRSGATVAQIIVTCFLVGFVSGVINAFLSLIRFVFIYPWLLLNLITEPVWSGLLAGVMGLITIGFFRLPKIMNSVKNNHL